MIDRIQKIIHQKKLSSSGFADLVGVPRSTISHLLSGRNNPSLEFIQKVLDAFPDIATEWLIRGKGQMYIGDSIKNSGIQTPIPQKELPAQTSLFFDGKETSKSEGALKDHPKYQTSKPAPGLSENRPNIQTGNLKENTTVSDLDKMKGESNKEVKNTSECIEESDKKLKRIIKILLVYSDGTFSDYIPEQTQY